MIGFTRHARVTCVGARLAAVLQEAACWSALQEIDVLVCGVVEESIPMGGASVAVNLSAVQLTTATGRRQEAASLAAFLAQWHPDDADVRQDGGTVTIAWAATAFETWRQAPTDSGPRPA